jgi:hypothetical protein
MSTSDAALIASEFWKSTGVPDQFPRDLDKFIPLHTRATIVEQPSLTYRTVTQWLARHNVPVYIPNSTANLMGFMIADRGGGRIFVCSTDPPDERRFTLAHELSHLLLHYFRPRQQVIAALGPSAIAALNGERAPTIAELAAATLAGVRFGPHVHLLPRGVSYAGKMTRVEADTDELAVELVAPRSVRVRVAETEAFRNASRAGRLALLADTFGVPSACFDRLFGYELPQHAGWVQLLAKHVREHR